VIVAAKSTVPAEVTLPAAIEALQDTPIYARTTGYIAEVDRRHRRPGQGGPGPGGHRRPRPRPGAEPGPATLAQAKANLELARISADRWKELGAQNAVAQQDVDQKVADYAAGQAAVVAAQANVDRLTQLKDFQQVTAPYDGVVSARNAQVGALINAGAGTEIFHVAETDILRVFVRVPQAYVRSVHKGLGPTSSCPEFPGRCSRASWRASPARWTAPPGRS
jgi:multidrug efflux pump subunit AcrA (membrane-fusion protein)